MVQQTNGKSKTARPLGLRGLREVIASGGEVRRGTVTTGAFPSWEWQAFDAGGAFVAPVRWKAVQQMVDSEGLAVEARRTGINRRAVERREPARWQQEADDGYNDMLAAAVTRWGR